MQSDNFIFENEVAWETTGEGVRRQVMAYDEQIMLVKVEFKAGSEGYLHAHPHRQCTYVASGVFSFTIGETTKTVVAGDSLFMESDVPHGVLCVADGLLIDVFTPFRSDFLNVNQE